MRYLTSGYLKLFGWSMALDFLVESISRHSMAEAAAYAAGSPAVFLVNSLLVFLPFACLYVTRRRIFLFSLLTVAWLAVGCVNGFLLTCRTTPFTASDFRLVKYGLNVMTTYMNGVQIVSMAVGLVLAVGGLALLWRKAPVSAYRVRKELALFVPAVCLFLTLGMIRTCTQEGLMARQFGNIGQAYRDYGFAYCFSNSVFNVGIHKPERYGTETVSRIEKNLGPRRAPAAVRHDGRPNIVMVQLESFFDPSLWKGNPVSENPVPFFRSLKEEYPSGYLSVPSVGAGTANTEFECITGMNLDFFGPGEYPYRTVLQKTACESTAFVLKDLGYKTHAIHNNEGTFYDRNHVFPQMGFDTFTPIEYMSGIERNPTGWCEDKVLVSQIVDTLNSSPGQDFIYTISVQGHGAYPDFAYYCSQIGEMDGFIRELTEEVGKLAQPTVIVLYGDHLPGFSWEADEMRNGSLYQTEYVVWNNMGLPAWKTDLEAYQLSSYVMDLLGIHEGTMMRFHQRYLAGGRVDPDTYLKEMEVLEYDMLYGNREVYGGRIPFAATDMQMGIRPVEIETVTVEGGEIHLHGENFNEYSVVYIDGSPVRTEYRQPHLLAVRDVKKKRLNLDTISVRQVGRDKVVLGKEVVYRPEKARPANGVIPVRTMGLR